MNTCQAPYRFPEGFCEDLELDVIANRITPEAAAAELMSILAADHPCGEPASATVIHNDQVVHVCEWHREQYRTLFAAVAEN
jgi:hypothetical protein